MVCVLLLRMGQWNCTTADLYTHSMIVTNCDIYDWMRHIRLNDCNIWYEYDIKKRWLLLTIFLGTARQKAWEMKNSYSLLPMHQLDKQIAYAYALIRSCVFILQKLLLL